MTVVAWKTVNVSICYLIVGIAAAAVVVVARADSTLNMTINGLVWSGLWEVAKSCWSFVICKRSWPRVWRNLMATV